MGDRLIPLIMQALGQGVNSAAQWGNPVSQGIMGTNTPDLGKNIDIMGKIRSADDSAVNFVNYLMGANPNYLHAGYGQGGYVKDQIPQYPTAPVVSSPMVGYGEPGYGDMGKTKNTIMVGASAPKTLPVKQPSGRTNDLASSLVTRPNLPSASYPGYGDRGALTVPPGSNYVPQTAPQLVPGAYTVPAPIVNTPISWGPTSDYYGMQEQWTPAASGK
jgi:hypothetical protein